MTETERLFETFGELLYAMAMADGIIQPEELTALESIVENQTWSASVKWSFNYESTKGTDVESIYNKVINFCHNHGPSPHYPEFISAMKKIAEAANGIDKKEAEMIESFSSDLIERFQRDLDRKNN